jgi:hypothetical protein
VVANVIALIDAEMRAFADPPRGRRLRKACFRMDTARAAETVRELRHTQLPQSPPSRAHRFVEQVRTYVDNWDLVDVSAPTISEESSDSTDDIFAQIGTRSNDLGQPHCYGFIGHESHFLHKARGGR